jgi:hypothetical protein
VFLFFAAFGMLFLGGCSNEEKLLSYENPSSGDGKLTFVLPMEYNGAVTYAAGDSTAGLAAEYEFKNLFIYWFTLDGGVYKWVQTFEYGVGTTANNITFVSGTTPTNSGARTCTATIPLGTVNTASRFYIIANVNLTGGVMANDLKQLSPSTTSTEFEAIAADALDKNAEGYLTPLTTPIPMSIDKASVSGKVSLGYYESPSPQGEGVVSGVQMKRRVARFDIMNNKDYSGLEITNIVVSRARSKGWLQDEILQGSDFSAAGDIGDMYIPASGANGTSGSTDDEWEFTWDFTDPQNPVVDSVKDHDKIPDDFQGKAPSRDSLELNRAVFYLWPTVLEPTVDASNNPVDVSTGTEILIEGKYKNVTKLYRLMLPTQTKINANNRYTIRIERVTENTIGFDLMVDHWIEALDDSIVTSAPVETVIWSKLTDDSGTELADLSTKNTSGPDAVYEYCSDQVVKLIFQAEGGTVSDKGVVRVDMTITGKAGDDYLASDWALTNDAKNVHSDTKITYGTHYITKDTIYLQPTDAPIEYTLTIYNVAKTTDSRVIKLKSKNIGKTGRSIDEMVTLGAVMDGSTPFSGSGRWKKAIVTEIDAPTNPALPTKYNGYGFPVKVYANLGTATRHTTGSDVNTFNGYSGYKTTSIENLINYLKANTTTDLTYKSGDTFGTYGLDASAGKIVPLVPTSPVDVLSIVVSEYGLTMNTGQTSYCAIVLNGDKTASDGNTNNQFYVLKIDGNLGVRGGTGDYDATCAVTVLMDY